LLQNWKNAKETNDYVPLDPRLREQMLRVVDGYTDNVPIMYQVYRQNLREGAKIMKWLADHKITGKAFNEFFTQDCDNSFLKLYGFVVSKIEKEERPLYAGRDFIEN
jgi:hypothetical protein